MLLIVCVSNPLEAVAVGMAELTGNDVTGASVVSCSFSSSDYKEKDVIKLFKCVN